MFPIVDSWEKSLLVASGVNLFYGSATSLQIKSNTLHLGENSQEGNIANGIHQGTVLGSILFVIYINNLPAKVMSQIRMFADDMQNDLDGLVEWSN